MSHRKRRGRPSQGRPHEDSAPAEQDLPIGSPGGDARPEESRAQGATPARNAEGKEQSNGSKVGPEGLHVNGHADRSDRSPRYSWDNRGIVWYRPPAKDSLQPIPIHLTNFPARIISDVTRDDGVETTRHYEIAATLGDTPYRFTVPAHQFKSLGWVAEHLGASALIEPGQGLQTRIPHAIQVISGDIPRRHIYTHTGWREIDGANYFLHAGGALGTRGHRSDIEVELPEQLSRVELIEHESDAELKEAVRKSIGLLALTPFRVSAPMLAAVYRAPIGGSDITVAPWGKTGKGKTAFASIVQQHFGPQMDVRHLPLHWEHTANTIEAVLSAAKDIATVVDEYVPGESQGDRAKMQSKAERVIRAVGNASGRGRMRADLSLRPVKPPRCQLVSTGEEVPAGQSLRARMVSVEVRDGDMQWLLLSNAQAEAAAGTYATATAGYVMWLAQDLSEARQLFDADRLAVREAVQAQHKRVADAIAQLTASWNMFLFFAIAIGAIEEAAAERIRGNVWAGLMEVAAEQEQLQKAAEPVGRFRDLIVAAISTGKAYVADADTGGAPANPERWGWRRKEYEWSPQGDCVGWLDKGQHLYLQPDASYTVASKLGSIGIACETLSARLADAKVTVTEPTKDGRRNRVRRDIVGKRQRVLHVRTLGWLYPTDIGPIGPDGPDAEKTKENQEIGDGLAKQ